MRLHTPCNHEHSAEFSNRRRALFPSNTNQPSSNDCDLVSPLNFSSDSEEEENLNKIALVTVNTLVDYDILGVVEEESHGEGGAITTPIAATKNLSVDNTTIVANTPTQCLKTPQELSDNSQLPRLIRKSALEGTLSEITQPSHNCKVRTSLFPEIDMSVPTQTFYPKVTSSISPPRAIAVRCNPNKVVEKKRHRVVGKKARSRLGTINSGVSHAIKKPKRNKRTVNKSLLVDDIEEPVTVSPSQDDLVKCSPPPDPNNKIFKSVRHLQGVVSYTNGNITTTMKRSRPPTADDQVIGKRQGLIDFEIDDTSFEKPNNITTIIENLEDKENSNDILMSPTSLMCNMASGLVLNSPKRASVNLNRILDTLPDQNPPENAKLFPVFYPAKAENNRKRTIEMKNQPPVKRFKSISKDQMLLDAGQKRWGLTQCGECQFVYTAGEPDDETTHLSYHNAGNILRFNGWKNERVVFDGRGGGRVVQISPGDSKLWWKRIKDLVEFINRDLGYFDILATTDNCHAFIYVKNRLIVAALLAEPKMIGYKLLTTQIDQVDLCSEESYPIKCGISRIWVSQNYRKIGLASCLVDCLKKNFIFGSILTNDEIALSSPTAQGKIFGEKYFKTPNFLIYDM